jgi:iron complex transport system substrate-binding protein
LKSEKTHVAARLTATFLITLALASLAHGHGVSAIDDAGRTVSLSTPASRIVSLSPHATELLFAAGAGRRVVGVSEYSDYPEAAKKLPLVGSSNAFDIEAIAALKPDLAVVWKSGNSPERVAKLIDLGIPVFYSEPRNFAEIATSLERLGHLAGSETSGRASAAGYRARLEGLKRANEGKTKLRVFYQVWRAPIMTLNGEHLVSQVLRLCGGDNVFGSLPQLAPIVSAEAVLQANPEVIFAGNDAREVVTSWRRIVTLTAVKRGNLFAANRDWMSRAGPRILDGAQEVCENLDVARRNLGRAR